MQCVANDNGCVHKSLKVYRYRLKSVSTNQLCSYAAIYANQIYQMLCILWINAQINLYYCRTWDHKAVNLAPFIKSKHSAISISKHKDTTIGY